MMRIPLWLSILLLAAISPRCATLDDNEFPFLWPTIAQDKSYHIVYLLNQLSGDDVLTLEEWANFEDHLFRLDILSNQGRVSFVTNGQTGETFHYKPFTCAPTSMDENGFSALAELFKGYAINQNKPDVLSYGIGPLWLRVRQSARAIIRRDEGNRDPNDDTPKEVLRNYRIFDVQFKMIEGVSMNSYEYELRFYFPHEDWTFVEFVEWIRVAKDKKGNEKRTVQARARITVEPADQFSNSVFELPVGYGCKRAAGFDSGLDIELGQELLHAGSPNQVDLEVMISRSKDSQMQSWENNKYLVQMFRGQLHSGSAKGLRDYHAILTQSRAANKDKYESIRRVWSSTDDSGEAAVYTIDETSKTSCKIGHILARDYVRFPFPGYQVPTEPGDAAEESTVESETMGAPVPPSLSVGLILSLFKDQKDYHEIKSERVLSAKKVRNAHYEKRLDGRKEENTNLALGGWDGPISILKQIDYIGDVRENALSMKPGGEEERVQLSRDYRTSITLFYYSQLSTQLHYKVVIDILDNKDISQLELLRQIDISACADSDRVEDVAIKYHIKEPETLEILEANSESILTIFARNLFEQTPINPLQISRLSLDFGNQFFVRVKMTILDLSSYEIFDLKRGHALIHTDDSIHGLVTTVASNMVKCSRLCDFNGCFRFSYLQSKFVCRMELRRGVAGETERDGEDMYSLVDPPREYDFSPAVRPFVSLSADEARHHFSPRVVVEMLERMVEFSRMEMSIGVPIKLDRALNLWCQAIGTTRPVVLLKPLAVVHEMDSLKEMARLGNRLKYNGYTTPTEGPGRLTLRYDLLMESRKIHPSSGTTNEAATYEDCAKMCESQDCRYFSYCPSSLTCIISSNRCQSIDEIKSSLLVDAKCDVFALDFLSKFEDFGLTDKALVVRSSLKEASGYPGDCAAHCMQQTDFTCEGFYHCKNPHNSETSKPNFECLLIDKHIEPTFGNWPKLKRIVSESAMVDTKTKAGGECNFYSRSYIAQFDQFHGKTLDLASLDEYDRVGALTFKNLGAEECASRCIKLRCVAFEVCVDPKSSQYSQICRMIHRSVRAKYLKPKRQCSTFSISDRSLFSRWANSSSNPDGAKPDIEAPVAGDREGPAKQIILDQEKFAAIGEEELALEGYGEERKPLESSSSSLLWYSGPIFFLIGILMGGSGVFMANKLYMYSSRPGAFALKG